jgi:hypothetical protein
MFFVLLFTFFLGAVLYWIIFSKETTNTSSAAKGENHERSAQQTEQETLVIDEQTKILQKRFQLEPRQSKAVTFVLDMVSFDFTS